MPVASTSRLLPPAAVLAGPTTRIFRDVTKPTVASAGRSIPPAENRGGIVERAKVITSKWMRGVRVDDVRHPSLHPLDKKSTYSWGREATTLSPKKTTSTNIGGANKNIEGEKSAEHKTTVITPPLSSSPPPPPVRRDAPAAAAVEAAAANVETAITRDITLGETSLPMQIRGHEVAGAAGAVAADAAAAFAAPTAPAVRRRRRRSSLAAKLTANKAIRYDADSEGSDAARGSRPSPGRGKVAKVQITDDVTRLDPNKTVADGTRKAAEAVAVPSRNQETTSMEATSGTEAEGMQEQPSTSSRKRRTANVTLSSPVRKSTRVRKKKVPWSPTVGKQSRTTTTPSSAAKALPDLDKSMRSPGQERIDSSDSD